MAKRDPNPKGSARRYITMEDLGTFTEEVIFPGVDRILDEKITPLREEMRQGFASVGTSIRELSGEIAELKAREEDQKHEERIQQIE